MTGPSEAGFRLLRACATGSVRGVVELALVAGRAALLPQQLQQMFQNRLHRES